MRNAGAKPTHWVKLPCLCVLAATMAIAMMVLIAPYLSRKAISSDDPSRQLISPKQVWLESSSSQLVEDLPVGNDQPPITIPGKLSTTSLNSYSVFVISVVCLLS